MMHRLLVPSITATLVGLSATSLAGQWCIPRFRPTSTSTRALAMGGTNLTGRDDDVLFANPARLAIARGTSAALEYFDPDTRSGTLSAVATIASGGVGVGANYLTGQAVTGNCDIIGGQTDTVAMSRVQGTVGLAQTYHSFQIGVAATYLSWQVGDARNHVMRADVGVARDFRLADQMPLSVGLAVQNLGDRRSESSFLQFPLSVALGASTGGPVGPLDVALAGQVALRRLARGASLAYVVPALGAEVGYMWLDGYSVALRAGVRAQDNFESTRHWTAGAGLRLDRVSIDYALEEFSPPHEANLVAHRFGVRLR
ncbi:MAG TPA: hypothetical protein VJU87_01860 [Gemmatimonadaceae bacterium]|nr:hypothetical protein [Gemmatimonadaceae bacterium]